MDLAALEIQLTEIISNSGWLAPFAALVGGILTALNPCVLATVPLMIGFVGGYAEDDEELIAAETAAKETGLTGEEETPPAPKAWRRALWFSILFIVGFSLELTVLFSVSASVAPYLTGPAWRYVIAAICGLLAAHLIVEFHIPGLSKIPGGGRWTGSVGILVLGFMFGLVSMPCSGPVLMLLASLVPELGVPRAGLLLFLYGVGHSALILVAGVSVGTVQTIAESKHMHRVIWWIKKVAAILILGVGYSFLRS